MDVKLESPGDKPAPVIEAVLTKDRRLVLFSICFEWYKTWITGFPGSEQTAVNVITFLCFSSVESVLFGRSRFSKMLETYIHLDNQITYNVS